MNKALDVVLEEKRTEYYDNLTVLSKFSETEKKEDSKDENGLDTFKLITNLGFVNSSVVKKRNEIISRNKNFNQSVQQACKSLEFIKAISEYFGEGTILVKRDDFVHIIRKYGLAVGNFEDYTGIVPAKNLLEIDEEAMKKVQNLMDGNNSKFAILKDAYKYMTVRINDIMYDSDDNKISRPVRRYLNSFPLVLYTSSSYYSDSSEVIAINEYLSDYIPERELKKVHRYRRNRLDHFGMFITAPREEMMNASRGIRFIQKPKDPFICSLVPYGVVIYSRWGKEAEDESLARYDQLFARMRGL